MNRNYGKLNGGAIAYAPDTIRIGDTIYCTPTAEQYLACGWKRIDLTPPSEPSPSGCHYEPDGYSETEAEIKRKWKTVADTPIYRRFSKLKIYGSIAQLGAWSTIQSWLESKTINSVNGWMAFQLAQEISEDHPLFSALSDEARQLLGLTVEQFEEILNSCILED